MSKKDLSANNRKSINDMTISDVIDFINEFSEHYLSLPRQTQGVQPTKEFVERARMEGKTQGRYGCTSKRINMAFRPDIYKFIQTMSKARGETMTKFVNHIIEQAMEQYNDAYQQVMKFKSNF